MLFLYFLVYHLSLNDWFFILFLFYHFFFVRFFQLLTLFLVLINDLIRIFNILFNLVNIQIHLSHKINFYLLLLWIENVVLISELLCLMLYLLSILENLLFFLIEPIYLFFLTFVFLLKGWTYFCFSFNLFFSLFQFILHSNNLHMKIFCTFSIMIWWIFNFQKMLFQFLLLFCQLNIFCLNRFNFLHIVLKISMKPFNVISRFLIHLFSFFNFWIVMLYNWLHSLLSVANILLHFLATIHYLLFSILCLINLAFILCLLNLVLWFSFFERP